jgi:hypothetical protein
MSADHNVRWFQPRDHPPPRGTRKSLGLRYHRRLACVPISAKGDDRSLKTDLARRAVGRYPAVISRHRRDAYDTFRSATCACHAGMSVPCAEGIP